MKQKVLTAAKSMFITTFSLIFLILMLFITNESNKKLYGQGVCFNFGSDAIYVKNGTHKYKIELDKESCYKFFDWVYAHPQILPKPFSYILLSNSFVQSLKELIF